MTTLETLQQLIKKAQDAQVAKYLYEEQLKTKRQEISTFLETSKLLNKLRDSNQYTEEEINSLNVESESFNVMSAKIFLNKIKQDIDDKVKELDRENATEITGH